jgi:hypothetical protein
MGWCAVTAQTPEKLLYEGETLLLCAEPLAPFLAALGEAAPRFVPASTALWRGYRGAWVIEGGELRLQSLDGRLADQDGATALERLFPGRDPPITADWFTGVARAVRGDVLRYVHMGYESVFEEDLFFTFEAGRLLGVDVRRNTAAPEPSPPRGWRLWRPRTR